MRLSKRPIFVSWCHVLDLMEEADGKSILRKFRSVQVHPSFYAMCSIVIYLLEVTLKVNEVK